MLGLRRAFQIAGARTVIMSLWSVEDEPTKHWMEALYEARFARGLTTIDAVRDASLAGPTEQARAGPEHSPLLLGRVRRVRRLALSLE